MISESELLDAVVTVFDETSRGLAPWPDPHPDRSVLDEEYSRVTNPARYRLVGARADAWIVALVNAALAASLDGASVRWEAPPGPIVSRSVRLEPRASGALPLVIARSRLGDVDDAGVTLGVGEPSVCVDWFPECGCDACDSGSQDELDLLDQRILGVVTGEFRRLTRGDRMITTTRNGWASTGRFGRTEVEAILADPTGWTELSGTSWLDVD